MLNLKQLGKFVVKRGVDNSPAILTGIGVAGTAMTAYLTGRATWRAYDVILENKPWDFNKIGEPAPDPLSNKEKFLLVWKLYIPAVGTGLMTCTCIILANRVSSRRATALAAAYMSSQELFDEYREKIVEKIGEKKETEYHDEIVQERVAKLDAPVLMLGDGKAAFCDLFTNRFFESSRQIVEKAVNDLNYRLNNEGFADLNEFYALIGIDSVPIGDQVGWNSDNLLDLKWTAVLMRDGDAASAFEFVPQPKTNFDNWR